MSLVKKVNTFFDVGANIGYYSLLAALNNPDCRIISFEPASGPIYYFKKNIEANMFSNIRLEPIALSHTSGTIDFYEVKNIKYPFLKHNLGGASNAGSNTEESNFIQNTVPTITLDEYVIKNNIEGVDLIKMDTEGTENLILEHSSYVLSKMKPIIICETLFHVIENKLEDILKTNGYEFFNHTEHGLVKVATITRETDNGIRNCFFVHPDKFHFISEFIAR
jgi:FkbM family methyltransferase